MKVCVIRDEAAGQKEIGYLFYYEKSRLFSIEISDDVSERDVPVFFSVFLEKGKRTLDPEWSARWVQSRIVPSDRQNLGMILRENRLSEYNAFRLLLLANGRCSQDDCMVMPVKENQFPDWLLYRRKEKLQFAAALDSWNLFLVFHDGMVCRTDLKKVFEKKSRFRILLAKPERFQALTVLAGGDAVSWGDGIFLQADELRSLGEKLPFTGTELETIVRAYVMDTSDVCGELDCSRQYVSQMIQKNGLSVLKENGNNRLFSRGEINRLLD